MSVANKKHTSYTKNAKHNHVRPFRRAQTLHLNVIISKILDRTSPCGKICEKTALTAYETSSKFITNKDNVWLPVLCLRLWFSKNYEQFYHYDKTVMFFLQSGIIHKICFYGYIWFIWEPKQTTTNRRNLHFLYFNVFPRIRFFA